MSKYIIEIPDDVQYVLLNGKADNKYYTAVRPVAELEVLNSDYINENYGSLQDEAYQRGLNDAWEAARKIAQQWEEDTDTGHRVVIDDSIRITLDSMTASEAIAKLKAYEERKDDAIKVGDCVYEKRDDPRDFGVVTWVSEDSFYVMWKDGSSGIRRKELLCKTGKHYDIQSILEAMRTHD